MGLTEGAMGRRLRNFDLDRSNNTSLRRFTNSSQTGTLRAVARRSCNFVKNLGFSRYDFECQRGAICTSEAHSRQPATTKRSCPWQASAKAVISHGRKRSFGPKAGCESHENHVGDGFDSRPTLGVEQKAFMATYTDRVGTSNREVATSLRN